VCVQARAPQFQCTPFYNIVTPRHGASRGRSPPTSRRTHWYRPTRRTSLVRRPLWAARRRASGSTFVRGSGSAPACASGSARRGQRAEVSDAGVAASKLGRSSVVRAPHQLVDGAPVGAELAQALLEGGVLLRGWKAAGRRQHGGPAAATRCSGCSRATPGVMGGENEAAVTVDRTPLRAPVPCSPPRSSGLRGSSTGSESMRSFELTSATSFAGEKGACGSEDLGKEVRGCSVHGTTRTGEDWDRSHPAYVASTRVSFSVEVRPPTAFNRGPRRRPPPAVRVTAAPSCTGRRRELLMPWICLYY
jgi:hypothetical protein